MSRLARASQTKLTRANTQKIEVQYYSSNEQRPLTCTLDYSRTTGFDPMWS